MQMNAVFADITAALSITECRNVGRNSSSLIKDNPTGSGRNFWPAGSQAADGNFLPTASRWGCHARPFFSHGARATEMAQNGRVNSDFGQMQTPFTRASTGSF